MIHYIHLITSGNNNSENCWRKQAKTVFTCSKSKVEALELLP